MSTATTHLLYPQLNQSGPSDDRTVPAAAWVATLPARKEVQPCPR